jgi:hypothetical protein
VTRVTAGGCAAAALSASLEEIGTHVLLLRSTLITHAGIEDAVLRPAIERHLPKPAGPTDHQVIDAGFSSVLEAGNADDARQLLPAAIATTRKHFEKEEKIVFGTAERELPEEAQERLGAEWAARRL